MSNRPFYGWTLLAVLWGVMFLNLGFPAYGPAVINAAMAQALGLRRETLGNLFAVYAVMSGLPGPLVGLSVNRFGVRRTLMVGSSFIALGALLMATVVHTGLGGMLCYGVLVGTGVAAGSALVAQAGLARWFVRRRSLALAVLYSAGAIGGFVAAPSLDRLIQATGSWRAGWWLLAVLSVLAAALAAVFVHEYPADVGQMADRDDSLSDTRPRFVTRLDWPFSRAIRDRAYWALLVSMLGMTGGYTLFLAHGVVHLQDLGHSASVGAWAIGTMTATGLIGKIILAIFGDRLDPRYLFAAFMAVFAMGLLVIVQARALWQVFFFATCFGIGFGGGMVCFMSVLSNYYGTAAFASLAGVAVAINTVVSAIAPKVAGHLFDRGMGYGVTFYFLAAWGLLSAVALLFVPRPEFAQAPH